jgi:hypothetical protein
MSPEPFKDIWRNRAKKRKAPPKRGHSGEIPTTNLKLPILATLLAATTLLATLTALTGLRGLLTGLLVSAALATLLATLVLLLAHRMSPWCFRCANRRPSMSGIRTDLPNQ